MKQRHDLVAAGELMARLEHDPEYQQIRAERDRARAAREARIRQTLEPIFFELRDVGVVIEEWNDLVSRYSPLSGRIIDVLLSWLPRVDDVAVQEMIVRALAATTDEPFDGRPLASIFDNTTSESVRWAVANTLAVTRAEHVDGWVVNALEQSGSGKAREMLCVAVGRVAAPEIANPLLVSMLRDLPGHAAMGLAVSGAERELLALEKARQDVKGWKRREIDRAIRAIQKRIIA